MYATNPESIRFPLRRDSWHASFITRTFLFVFVSLALITFGLSLVNAFAFGLWWAAFLVAAPLIAIYGWRRYSIGTAELNHHEMVVQSRAHTQRYPWKDVAAISAGTLDEAEWGPDAWILRAMGLDMKRPIALVDLQRQYHESLVWARGGTRTMGIPMGKRVKIEVEDVHGFGEAANALLKAARSSH